MTQTLNPGAMEAQADGMKLYHLELQPCKGTANPEHYYFPTLDALKIYAEKELDAHDWHAWAYIMEIGEDGNFEDVWECTDINRL